MAPDAQQDSGPAPVSAEEFAAALAALAAPRRVLVALSGGPDSMALLRLAAAAGYEAVAATVDHGLRPGARAEAEQAGRWCRDLGLPHRRLDWTDDKPASGVQAAARAARYRLLAMTALEERCEAVLTGHNADDQAETVFMRLARGAGPAGLSGMAGEIAIAAGPLSPVRLLRPLLSFPRARIAATLTMFEQASLDDPSNDDPGFERVRARALLAALGEQALLTRDALLATAARMRVAAGRLRAAEDAAFRAAGGAFHPLGAVSLADAADLPAGLFARLFRAVGGGEHAPDEGRAADAVAAARKSGRASLAGALAEIGRDGRLWIYREPAALLGRGGGAPAASARLGPGDRLLWDNRFAVENAGGEAVDIAALALANPALEIALAAETPGLPRRALALAPWPVGGGAAAAGPESAPIRLQSLLEERLFTPTVRFP